MQGNNLMFASVGSLGSIRAQVWIAGAVVLAISMFALNACKFQSSLILFLKNPNLRRIYQ